MKNLKLLLPILFITYLFIACDDDKDEDQKLDATITIESPTTGQVFEKGDTVLIKATIESVQELHGWQVVIRRKADNSIVYENDRHEHGEVLIIQEKWVNNVTAHTDLMLEVTAALDHTGKNLKTETVSFHCHPN